MAGSWVVGFDAYKRSRASALQRGELAPRFHEKKNEEVLGVSGDFGEPDGLGSVCEEGGGWVAILFPACAGD